jgi:hypothetical protein
LPRNRDAFQGAQALARGAQLDHLEAYIAAETNLTYLRRRWAFNDVFPNVDKPAHLAFWYGRFGPRPQREVLQFQRPNTTYKRWLFRKIQTRQTRHRNRALNSGARWRNGTPSTSGKPSKALPKLPPIPPYKPKDDPLPKSDDWYRQVISLGVKMAKSEARRMLALKTARVKSKIESPWRPEGLPMTYSVLIDDNFHHTNENERHTLGSFPTLEAAIAACRDVVDQSLDHLLEPGMTAEALYDSYKHFGDDPFIAGEPPSTFSAWNYAKRRAAEMIVKSPPIAP